MLKRILADQLALLTFRPFRPDLQMHYRAYITYGLIVTWIAGMGRYWDNPNASWWQLAGIGSLVYVFLLAALLWVVIAPLRPARWRYADVLLFLTMTSLPALLYAIPVEMFMPLPQAQAVNGWFLVIVATWRVVLLVLFLRRAAQLSGLAIVVATLLPLAIIITLLGMLNLEHVVFNIMAGNSDTQQSPNDTAYKIVFVLTIYSMIALPFLMTAYIILAIRRSTSKAPGLKQPSDHV